MVGIGGSVGIGGYPKVWAFSFEIVTLLIVVVQLLTEAFVLYLLLHF